MKKTIPNETYYSMLCGESTVGAGSIWSGKPIRVADADGLRASLSGLLFSETPDLSVVELYYIFDKRFFSGGVIKNIFKS